MSAVPDKSVAPPAIGTPAPTFALPDLDGRQVTLGELTVAHHLVLFFMREFT